MSAITSFILLMALHPDVQTRAQAEIDEICGQDQMPHPSHLGFLTYLQAVLKEVLRFAPVGNLGEWVLVPKNVFYEYFLNITFLRMGYALLINDAVALPHKVIKEDIYREYTIPENATVIGNVWYVQLL